MSSFNSSSTPGASTSDVVTVGVARRIAAAAALLFGSLTAVLASRVAAAPDAIGVAMTLLGIALTWWYAKRTFQRGPALVIDAVCLRDVRRDQTIEWQDARRIYVRQRQGAFDEYHDLVIIGRDGEIAVELPLDQLSMPWGSIVTLIEERAQRRIETSTSRGT